MVDVLLICCCDVCFDLVVIACVWCCLWFCFGCGWYSYWLVYDGILFVLFWVNLRLWFVLMFVDLICLGVWFWFWVIGYFVKFDKKLLALRLFVVSLVVCLSGYAACYKFGLFGWVVCLFRVLF